jgi:hypothetical protein
VKGPQ